MVSLVFVSGCVVVGLAVLGALALALLLSPALRSYPANWLEKHLFPDANQITPQQMARSRDQSKVYRILAFGDSLTEGFTQGGSAFHPYAKRLGDLLYPQLPKDWHLEIEEQGESGERVLFGMKDRLQRTLEEHTAAGRLYDWVLLLGGINDLAGDNSSAEEVLTGLDVLVQQCVDHGANVLLMTLMEVAFPMASVEEQRRQLNKQMTDYVQRRKSSNQAAADGSDQLQGAAADGSWQHPRRSRPQVFLFDLASAFPYEGLDDDQRFELWDDGVHLTLVGYERMGVLITEALQPLAKQELSRVAVAGIEQQQDAGNKKLH